MQKHITEVLKDCYPSIPYNLEVLEKTGKHIIAVEIFHRKDRPHFSGPAYIRDGSKSVIASKEKFEELVATRHSKVYEILKWKDKIISVVARGKRLGSLEHLADSRYQEPHECRIEECTAHTIQLNDIAKGMWFVEPLDNITLSKDVKNFDRLMLIVQEK